MTKQELEAFLKLSDPNNEFMRQIKYGTVEDLQQLSKRQLHKQIAEKYSQS
jgi:hypothetical protein